MTHLRGTAVEPERAPPKIAIQAVLPMLARLSASGVNVGAFLVEHGLDPRIAADPDARLPLVVLDPMWERAAQLAGDPDLGLHVASSVGAGSFGVLSHLATSSATFGDGLDRVCRYFRIFSDASSYHLQVEDDVATLVATQDVPASGPVRQRVEFTVAVVLFYSRRHVDAIWSPLEALFEHPEPDDIGEHRRIFGCPLRFRSPVSGLRVASRLLGVPLRGGDPSLAGILEAVASDRLGASGGGSCSQALRRAFLEPGGVELSLEDAARKLGLSMRTLQRRLTEEGTTGKRILDEMRFHVALRMLRRPHTSVSDVAFALGFSEPAALCRAFKRWTGQSPGEYRRAAGD